MFVCKGTCAYKSALQTLEYTHTFVRVLVYIPFYANVCVHTCLRSAALERAKEAGRKERALLRFREEVVQTDNVNPDLTWAVLYNLALMY